MATFAQRLQAVMRDGNLTGADLARWLGRADPTVRAWLSGKNVMRGPEQDAMEVERLLKTLETAIRQGKVLPVPRLSAPDRIEYLSNLRRKLCG